MGKRGKKDCPNCEKELGGATVLCGNCGYHFPTKEVRLDLLEEKKNTISNVNKTYDTPGKGRKTCPSCNIIIASIIKVCFKCNFDFIAAKKEKLEKEEKEREEKREARAEKNRIKEEERKERRERKKRDKDGFVKEVKMHPEVKKMMDSQELIEKMNDITINGATYFTPDEHADRILEYGENRIKSLLRQHKSGSKWSHVNWERVEEGMKEKI